MINTQIKFGEVESLSGQIEFNSEKVAFSNVFDNANGGVALLAFKAGQGLEAHQANAEVMVYVVEGEIQFDMIDTPHILKAGEFLLMGSAVTHSVKAVADSKVMLVKIKP